MEDLIGLIFIILFAVINLLAKADKKKKQSPVQPGESPPKSQPRSIEEFFEEIAKKFDPQPAPQPAWPESIERPDYMEEMEEYERAQANAFEEEPAVVIPTPPQRRPASEKMMPEMHSPKAATVQAPRKLTAFKLPVQGAVFSGLGGMRIKTPPLLRSAAGQTDFDLDDRKQLKQALIASMVFGQPRAYDTSFDNTIAK